MTRIVMIWFYVGVLALFLVDQLTKLWARHCLDQQQVYVFKWLQFDLVFNTGAAYGFFGQFTTALLWLGIAVIVYLIGLVRQLDASKKWECAGYLCLLSGALGNTYDRLVFGQVTDFINIHIIPVFNGADMLLNMGVIFLIVSWIRDDGKA